MNFGKKASALILAVIMVMSFAGCSQFATSEIDEKAVLTTVGDVKLTAGMMNFYARQSQSLLEGYYSQSSVEIWTQEVERGVTYEDTMKEEILKELQDLYLIQINAEEYELSVTEDELKAIETAADAFEKANTEEAKDKASAKKEYAVEYLKLVTLQEKLLNVLEAKHLEAAEESEDADATSEETDTTSEDADTAKETAETKAQEEYATILEGWRKNTKITVDKKLWAKISFHDLQVMPIYDDTTTDDTTKDDTTKDDTTKDDTTTDSTTTDDATADSTTTENK